MASRDWPTIQHFPSATRTKLIDSLKQLKQENVSTLTVLVIGKGGVGKSSTVNSVLGERAVAVSLYQSQAPQPVMVTRFSSRYALNIGDAKDPVSAFTLHIIDTPGLDEAGAVNYHVLDMIKRYLLGRTIDVLLYVDRLDQYRVDSLDRQIIAAITDSFGKEIWRRGIVVLTHALLIPPDGLDYDEFFSRRSEALLEVVGAGAKIKRQEVQGAIPVVLVENSTRCPRNENDEKIIPTGIAWIPNLMKTITEVVSNGSKGIRVDKKLIDGPNPNQRGKWLIPFIAAFQYLFIVMPLQLLIENDAEAEREAHK
ncbi:Translocase of chloroplast [Heracleum sosnowskyi]|uniref:Translocase of chloroplast n=1 Tax=Heracleum sosnowskyi TaxID=360622 RepID=A0AAD8HW25_9APIA|nr:Translocase of chloroplast [Heracleum sosnowskyi]